MTNAPAYLPNVSVKEKKVCNIDDRTIGSTYMAASGINPLESEGDENGHLCDLVSTS